jgi:hypothetical protein
MSKEILDTMVGQYKRAFGMVSSFIDVSTDEIWTATSGGFPGWQQVYHAMECVFFFLAPVEHPERASLYSMDVLLLKDVDAPAPSKADMKKLCAEADAYADKFFASLSDADLVKPHEGLSARLSNPMNIAAAIGIMHGHFLYHLGFCDAILREHGKPTIF